MSFRCQRYLPVLLLTEVDKDAGSAKGVGALRSPELKEAKGSGVF